MATTTAKNNGKNLASAKSCLGITFNLVDGIRHDDIAMNHHYRHPNFDFFPVGESSFLWLSQIELVN